MERKFMRLLLIPLTVMVLAVSANGHSWPVWPDSSYHQIMQLYGLCFTGETENSVTGLHNGIDIVVPVGTTVYAIESGYVKAVLTLSDQDPLLGAAYWRVVIGDSAGTQPCDGWMYAHILESSISVEIGDWVDAGDSIAVVVSWYDETYPSHLHLSEVNFYGNDENWTDWRNWGFIGNPLDEIDNVNDTINPIIENAYNNQLLAFCSNETSDYFDEGEALSGDVDIITRAYDNHNWFAWKNNPYIIEYSIGGDSAIPWTNSIRFSQNFGSYYDYAMYNYVFYKDDNICNTFNDIPNNGQKFYFIVTNTDGDTITETSDMQYSWQTANFHNGAHVVRIRACDRSGNCDLDSMTVNVSNYFALSGHIDLSDGNPLLAGTRVRAVPDGIEVTTDATGDFSIPMLGGGSQIITFTRAGYETIDTAVMMNESREINLILAIGPFVCGDANSDGKLNLLDISFIINALYRGGPKPNTKVQADVNSDGKLNLLDVSYIISSLYRHGPAPDCP